MNAATFDASKSFNQYIQLMVSQIQYQDPLDPVSQESTTAQLAQISTVSGIEKLNLQFSEMLRVQSLFDGMNLVGRQVEFKSPESGEVVSGIVSEARVTDGSLKLTVNGEQISLDDIRSVAVAAAA